MKFKKILFASFVFASLSLASCGPSIKESYTDTNGEIREVTIKPTEQSNDVYECMKVLASKKKVSLSSYNTMTIDEKISIAGSVKGIGTVNDFKGESESKTIASLKKLELSTCGKDTYTSQFADTKYNLYLKDKMLYVNFESGKNVTRYKTEAPNVTSVISSLDKFEDFFMDTARYNLAPLLKYTTIKASSYSNLFEAVIQNETEIMDLIKDKNIKISSVDDDYIYLSYTLKDADIVDFCKNTQILPNGLTQIKTASSLDELLITIGFNREDYLITKINLNFENAQGALFSISRAMSTSIIDLEFGFPSMSTASLSSYTCDISIYYNKDEVEVPAEALNWQEKK